jgi:hypothetical protein
MLIANNKRHGRVARLMGSEGGEVNGGLFGRPRIK